MVKALDAPYEAGSARRRLAEGQASHTRSIWSSSPPSGARPAQGWLSNLHLGARDPDSGGYVMLGKTFKGLTDEMLAWQTAQLLGSRRARDSSRVHVRPELVVEIAFDGVQTSPRYPGGLALRFARVKGYRRTRRRTKPTRSTRCARSMAARRRRQDDAGGVGHTGISGTAPRRCGPGRGAKRSRRGMQG